MDLARVESIVNAVLYEGYMLYPYRPTSVKNRQRWTFGGLYPRSYSAAQDGTDAWAAQTECLVVSQGAARVDVKVRFLHLLSRDVRAFDHPEPERFDNAESAPERIADLESASHPVDALWVGDWLIQTWQEAEEREVDIAGLDLAALTRQPREVAFAFPACRTSESLVDPSGNRIGLVIREQQPIQARAFVCAERLVDQLFKLTVRIKNETDWEARRVSSPGADPRTADNPQAGRAHALMCSLISTHTILGIQNGQFVSLLDPPPEWGAYAARCRNVGAWPVLVGDEGEQNMMLSSPIILYDYPQVAPESPGNLFDGTEIDEILTLRIMTLTEDEKREMVAVDEHARALLERTQALTAEQLMRLHGSVRGLEVRASEVQRG